MTNKSILYYILLLFTAPNILAQENWELEKDKNNIKVFTLKKNNASIKDSKTELIINASAEKIKNEFLNIANHKIWMHRIIVSEPLKTIDTNKFYAYYEASAPWPVSNRDIIVLYSIQTKPNGTIFITAIGDADFLPKKKGKIRVPRSESSWELIPQNNNTTKVIHITSSDSGGSIPAWLANSVATETPFNTVSALKSIVEKP